MSLKVDESTVEFFTTADRKEFALADTYDDEGRWEPMVLDVRMWETPDVQPVKECPERPAPGACGSTTRGGWPCHLTGQDKYRGRCHLHQEVLA